jgi:hypothetical protein
MTTLKEKKRLLNQLNKELSQISKEERKFYSEMEEKYNTGMWFAEIIYKGNVPSTYRDDIKIKRSYDNKASELCKQIKKLEAEIKNDEDLEAYRKMKNSNEVFDEDLFQAAIDEFGVTDFAGSTGFILPDGTQLNLSRGSAYARDHRDIGMVYYDLGIYLGKEEDTYLIDFMNKGVIRYMPEGNGFNLQVEPTDSQYSVMKNIINSSDDDVYIDFDNSNGGTVHSVSYRRGTNANRIVNDIYKYYNEHIKPLGNSIYEEKHKNEVTLIITEEQYNRLFDIYI